MPALDSIPTLSGSERELLEAVGWTDLRELAEADPAELLGEVEKANRVLAIVDEVPGHGVVCSWVAAAREELGMPPLAAAAGGDPDGDAGRAPADGGATESPGDAAPANGDGGESAGGLVNFEAEPEIREMIERSPVAIPIPNRLLAGRGISPVEVPPAPVLNRASGDIDVRVAANLPKPAPPARSSDPAPPRAEPRRSAAAAVKRAEQVEAPKRELDVSRLRSFDEFQDPAAPKRVRKDEPASEREEKLNLLRTARPETNRGKDPNSRRFIRGVLHDRPLFVWFGSLIFLLLCVVLPAAMVSAVWLAVSEPAADGEPGGRFWLVVIPSLVPLLGLLYLLVSARVKCRVCGQRVLMPRQCLKNRKAHHIRGLGHMVPLAIHVLLFRWFNCTFCGTSIRIKE